jgi:hypothetical protein
MRKYIVVCIVVLLFILGFTPYIKAVYVPNQESTFVNNFKQTKIPETINQGFDLAILDIVPYIWEEEEGQSELHLTLEIKNIGDSTTTGMVKYDGNSSYFLTKGNYSRAWGALLIGSLDPGEIWIPKASAGLIFLNIIPRIFTLEYEVTPLDSNPDNNYIRQVYFIKGGGIIPLWKHLPVLE